MEGNGLCKGRQRVEADLTQSGLAGSAAEETLIPHSPLEDRARRRRYGRVWESKIMKIRWIFLMLFVVFSLVACEPQNPNVNQTANTNSGAANAKWDAYVDQFITDHFTANPHFGVYQGRHEFDGKLA